MQNTITRKRKVLFFIPFTIVAIALLYSWILFITSNYVPFLQHYLGLIFFLPVIYFLLMGKNIKKSVVLLGIYLLLATVSVVSFFTFISTSSIGINMGPVKFLTPGLNGYSLLLLILYGILNCDTLIDICHDYKESKGTL